MPSPLAFFASDAPSPDERPGHDEVSRRHQRTTETLEAIDQPADMLAEALDEQLACYEGPMPANRKELQSFVLGQFRRCASVSAVSAMLERFIESDEQSHIAAACRRLLVVIRSQSRPALTCDCLATAFGFHLGEGRTMDEMAAAHGVTKQAFSKRTIRLCRELGVPPSVLMRSEASRSSYREKQLQRHGAARAAGLGLGSFDALRKRLAESRQHVTGAQLRASACA